MIALLLLGTSEDQKLKIRAALMYRKVDPALFLASPDQLKGFGFIGFQESPRKQFKNEFKSALENYLILKNVGSTPVETIKTIVLLFSKNGVEGGCGTFSDHLMENIVWVTRGHGCCSDHSQTFTALALLNGINAREVHHKAHTFNEFWDEKNGSWIWVDPQYALLAKDETGKYLGLRQIQVRMANNQRVVWEFFGTAKHTISSKPIGSLEYFKPNKFSRIIMTLGNNVFQEDEWNVRLAFMPRAVRQVVLYLVGIKPGYGYFDDVVSGPKAEDFLTLYRSIIGVFFAANVTLLWACLKRSGANGR
jgi:hypothetical protein